MNHRIRKKIARRFLNGDLESATRFAMGFESYWVEETIDVDAYITEIVFPDKIRRAIFAEAYRRGWDGNHWDNPLIIDMEEVID